jgi:hypothetical protein
MRQMRQRRMLSGLASVVLAVPLLVLMHHPATAQTTPGTPGALAAPGAEPRISLTLRDTPLRSALELLFQQSGVQHAVEAAVPNVPVTLNLRDATFATALRVITRLAGVTYRREGDVYVIGLRQPPPIEPTTEIAPPEEAAVATEQTWEKIPIQFNHAAVFGYAFGGIALPNEIEVQGGGLGGGGLGGGGFGGGLGGFGGGGFGGGLGGFGGGLGGGLGGFDGGFGSGFGGFGGGLGGFGGGLGGFGGGLGGFGGGLGGGFGGGLGGTGGGFVSGPGFRRGGRF